MSKIRHWGLIAAFVAGVLATSAPSQEKPKQEKPLVPGGVTAESTGKFSQTWSTTSNQKVTWKVDGMKERTATFDQKVEIAVTWTPAAKTAAGGQDEKKAKYNLTFDSVAVTVDVTNAQGDGKKETIVPSSWKTPAAAAANALKAVSIPVTIDTATMTPSIDRDDLAAAVRMLTNPGQSPAERAAIQAALDRDALLYQISLAMPALPKEGATPASATIKGQYGTYAVKTSFGPGKEADGKLTSKGSSEWTFSPSTETGAVKVAAKPAKVELEGDFEFDTATKRLAKGTLETKKDTQQTFTVTSGTNPPAEVTVSFTYTVKINTAQSPMQK
jgi:hypothetical protein